MYFRGLIAHDAVVSETIYFVAENFHLAHKGAQLAYPDSRLVWLFPVDEDDVPAYIRGSAEEGTDRELLDIARRLERK
jgi:hypothetical protein